MSTARAEHGFTLIEALVALAVFSLAALALLRLDSVAIRSSGDLEARSFADIEAQNLMVGVLTDPAPPIIGASGGTVLNGGRVWTWKRVASPTPDPALLRVELLVTGRSPAARAALAFVVRRR